MSTQLGVTWHRRVGDVDAICTDINADGLFVCTDETVQPGALIELRLQLPAGTLHVLATVRFVGITQSGRGFGVELFTMSKQARRRWLGYYRRQAVPTEVAADAVVHPPDDEDDGIGPIALDLGGLEVQPGSTGRCAVGTRSGPDRESGLWPGESPASSRRALGESRREPGESLARAWREPSCGEP